LYENLLILWVNIHCLASNVRKNYFDIRVNFLFVKCRNLKENLIWKFQILDINIKILWILTQNNYLQSWQNNLKSFQQTLHGLLWRCWTIIEICWNVFQKLFNFKICNANYMISSYALHIQKNTLKLFQQYLYNIVGQCCTFVGICCNVFPKLFNLKIWSVNFTTSTTN